jgi:NifB/MoaA-like Fe-S oxidoreductase
MNRTTFKKAIRSALLTAIGVGIGLFFTSLSEQNRESQGEAEVAMIVRGLHEDMLQKTAILKEKAVSLNDAAAVSERCREIGASFVEAKYHKIEVAVALLDGKDLASDLDPNALGERMISEGCSTGHVLSLVTSSYNAIYEVKNDILVGLGAISEVRNDVQDQ